MSGKDKRSKHTVDAFVTWLPEYCKDCRTCEHICPVDNLSFNGDKMVSAGKCIQCGLCMNYCPDFAVEVKPKPKKPSAKSKEAVR
ncbi:MAG: 4Fe-4S binding protein [Acidobacteria bacterium]|nr:4Fe-4S binding protein [Acidobacteriota bacterium]MBU1474274.1 4Fe-4S binding protein [Acidobacteriota bacterium]MBU4203589.1 4Fe-4S binding protein [Acidobacteriota bacterium]MBU4253576.1 4Fe-4S binding protein [Acidobacteriota bacterium]